jgi:6-phosphogluconolactonase
VDWSQVHLFWGDERCVPPEDPDSNYEMAYDSLIQHIPIPKDNVHRIHGENDPVNEVRRYTYEMEKAFGISSSEVPRFDWILLGMGADGHTASLFPGQGEVLASQDLCAVAVHPETGQKRITLTLPVLNNAACVSFLVTGLNKAGRLASVLRDPERRKRYPAALVQAENTEWWVDREAAFHILYTLE